jgi:Mitochondrial inner membrane protein
VNKEICRSALAQSWTVRQASHVGGAGSGGAGKAVAATLLVTTGVVGGTIGYAAVDPGFRKSLGDTVPGTEDVLQLILGQLSVRRIL